MDSIVLRNKKEFLDYFEKAAPHRCAYEQFVADAHRDVESWETPGFCEACGQPARFHMSLHSHDNGVANFREGMNCEFCGMNNRQRFIASFMGKKLKKLEEASPSIYLYEQITNIYKWFEINFPKCDLIGSEYLGDTYQAGAVFDGIRHEDAMNLSFSDKSFDMIAGNDVFEHVPDIEKALAESHRVLKDNGMMAFTIPFFTLNEKSVRRAEIVNDELVFILPEVYHGNPVDKKGSLVFYDFGWDILDMCRQAGFKDAYVLGYYSLLYGYLGHGLQFLFVAEKK